MKRLVREPLVHFLLIGGALLALAAVFSAEDFTQGGGDAEAAQRKIYVEPDALRRFVQAKTRISDAAFSGSWEALDAAARSHWVDLYVREESLVREARRLGLDRQDDLIRRRLVQQLEFVAIGRAEPDLDFGEQQLQEIYLERRDDYVVPAALSFSHVFIRVADGADSVAIEDARSKAASMLLDLNAENIDVAGAMGRGDHFLYNRNYLERTHAEIASHFGEGMLRLLRELEPDAGQWKGPIRSSHGFHLVLLTGSEASRIPSAEEIRGLLREDWLREQRDAALDRAVADIVSGFEVEMAPELVPLR